MQAKKPHALSVVHFLDRIIYSSCPPLPSGPFPPRGVSYVLSWHVSEA